jgi:hypothetical protein
MENKINTFDKVQTIKQNLDGLISDGGEIKRQDILDAEEISFNTIIPSNIIYDEYGFINNIKENSKEK